MNAARPRRLCMPLPASVIRLLRLRAKVTLTPNIYPDPDPHPDPMDTPELQAVAVAECLQRANDVQVDIPPEVALQRQQVETEHKWIV